MKKLIFAALLALPAADSGAIELLLEENRGESGTIGYVDIDRVFKDYSGTTGAREDFLSEIKKKEDSLNTRKTAIFTLKAELAKLRQEREFAATLPSLMETQRSVAQAAAETEAAARALAAAKAAVEGSSAAVAASSGAPAAQQPAVSPSTGTPPAGPPPELPGVSGIDMPGIARVPVSHFKFSVSTSIPEIDAAIERKTAELAAKEEELRQAQLQSERELLEYESRKTELLLGRIYVALKELAVKEEVSVIIDKRNILYGQNAVDLTPKLLRKLEENGI